MGGFEGGDEGGFWDIDPLPGLIEKQKNRAKHANKMKSCIQNSDGRQSIKAHAKITIFQKVIREADGHLSLHSRLIRLEDLYDTISFIPCNCNTFTIEGCDGIPIQSNSIYKAYKAICDYTNDPEIDEFFDAHKVVVDKGIPASAGLGASASDAAAFILLLKEVCNLVLSLDEVLNIASSIGQDLPFFIYNCASANVSNFGACVEAFEEEALKVKLYSAKTKCDLSLLYQACKEELPMTISASQLGVWKRLDSKSLLKQFTDPTMVNDLYASAHIVYPELKKEAKEGWFFSGSSFFILAG